MSYEELLTCDIDKLKLTCYGSLLKTLIQYGAGKYGCYKKLSNAVELLRLGTQADGWDSQSFQEVSFAISAFLLLSYWVVFGF